MAKGYPKWVYHKTEKPKIIQGEQDESPEWLESPAFFDKKAPAVVKPVEVVAPAVVPDVVPEVVADPVVPVEPKVKAPKEPKAPKVPKVKAPK